MFGILKMGRTEMRLVSKDMKFYLLPFRVQPGTFFSLYVSASYISNSLTFSICGPLQGEQNISY